VTPLRRRLSAILLGLVMLPGLAGAGGLELRTLDGEPSSLGEQLVPGRWTLVMAWTTYCGVCREQYPVVSEFHSRHAADGGGVLGIALDGYAEADKVARYRVSQQHSFPSVLAEADSFGEGFERAAGEAFTGTPTYLLFDSAGKLRAFLSGPVTRDTLERAIEP